MAMTKKNYQQIAKVIARVDDWDTRVELMVDLGREFEKDNDRFDYWLFKRAVEAEREALQNA